MTTWHKTNKITDRLDELFRETAQDLEDASDATKALLFLRLCEYFDPHGLSDRVFDLVKDAGTDISTNDQYGAWKYHDGSVLYEDACGYATAPDEQEFYRATDNPKIVWDHEADGPFSGDVDTHRELVTQRAKDIFGNDAKVQLSSYGPGHWSIQVFDDSGGLVADIDLTR